MKYCFSYGSNMSQSQVYDRLGAWGPVKEPRAAKLSGYKLVFNKYALSRSNEYDRAQGNPPGTTRVGAANIVATGNSDDVVEGVVYSLNEAQLAELDRLEGARSNRSKGYKRTQRTLEDGSLVEIYIAKIPARDNDHNLKPSASYVKLILTASQHLSSSYIQKLLNVDVVEGGKVKDHIEPNTVEQISKESHENLESVEQENSKSDENIIVQDKKNEDSNYIDQLMQKFIQHKKWNAYSRSKPTSDDFYGLKKLPNLDLETLNLEFTGANEVHRALLNLLAYTAKIASESPSFFKSRNTYREEKLHALINFFNNLPDNTDEFTQHIDAALTNKKLTANRTTGFFSVYGRRVGKRNTVGDEPNHHWVQSTTEELIYEIKKAHETFNPV